MSYNIMHKQNQTTEIHRNRRAVISGLLLILLLISGNLWAQQSPKHEFRGVWIATVKNIDWPLSRNGRVDQQQREFREMLALHQAISLGRRAAHA